MQNRETVEPFPRRSELVPKPTKSTRFRNYVVYLQDLEFNSIEDSDPTSFHKAISSPDNSPRLDAKEHELASMKKNGIWDLVELLTSCKTVGCKWVFKIKCDAREEVERYKVDLLLKDITREKA